MTGIKQSRLTRQLWMALFICFIGFVSAQAKPFSFAVLGDPRSGKAGWVAALTEVRDTTVNPEPAFPKAELLITVGDMDPIKDRFKDFETVFASPEHRPVFLPVMGNHDTSKGESSYTADVLIPMLPKDATHCQGPCDYTFDYQNARFIVVDQYGKFGKSGVINDAGLAWVEKSIQDAPAAIQHIFVVFHEPAFPRHRHINDSFDKDKAKRDAFWKMLVRHSDKVRAVFVGHTHYYSRMRVLDPASKAANDKNALPDEPGGIYQVDAGGAGNGEVNNTVVEVLVDGDQVHFRAIEAPGTSGKAFALHDEWSLTAAMPTPTVAAPQHEKEPQQAPVPVGANP